MAAHKMKSTYFMCISHIFWLLILMHGIAGSSRPLARPDGAAVDEIKRFRRLPIGPDLGSLFSSGYITVDAVKGRRLFYVFGEAHSNPADKPLIFWMNGGPGCSSAGLGFLQANGPVRPVSNATMLLSNPNSLTTFANVLWLDQPAFTGFSTSRDEGDRNSDDTKSGLDMLTFLLQWYERFPQFKKNKLFLAGQSYAGHYGPLLAKRMLDYNKSVKDSISLQRVIPSSPRAFTFNLQGLAMGNPWTSPSHDNTATVNLWYDSGIISRETYESLKKCDMSSGALWRTDGKSGFSPACESMRDRAYAEIGRLNKYGLNAPTCLKGNVNNQKHPAIITAADSVSAGFQLSDPCAEAVSEQLMNMRSVQLALGAIQPADKTRKLRPCAGRSITYPAEDLVKSMVPVYKELLAQGVPVLVYNGDSDTYIPVAGTRGWVESLNLPLADPAVPIRLWLDTATGQIGGDVVEYQGLTRVSVHLSGHSVGAWQPAKNMQIMKTFVTGGQLPTFTVTD